MTTSVRPNLGVAIPTLKLGVDVPGIRNSDAQILDVHDNASRVG